MVHVPLLTAHLLCGEELDGGAVHWRGVRGGGSPRRHDQVLEVSILSHYIFTLFCISVYLFLQQCQKQSPFVFFLITLFCIESLSYSILFLTPILMDVSYPHKKKTLV